MDRINQRLNIETSKSSVNTDSFLKINLDNTNRVLPLGEINNIIDVSKQFNKERQASKRYRIINTIKPTISNVLFNLTNPNILNEKTFAGFNNVNLFLDTSFPKDGILDIDYPTSIINNLKEVNGWFGYYNPDKPNLGLSELIDMEPSRTRFSFNQDIKPFNNSQVPINNWDLTLTYPESSDKTHYMVKNGLLIVEKQSVMVSNRNMVAFGVACLHNLNIGDMVSLSGTNGYDGQHVVVRTGLDNGDLKGYFFVIDILPTGTIGLNSRMKRIIGVEPSEYYFRIFKKINTNFDYESYKLSFSQNIYSDELTQCVFNDDIDVSNLVDNLGRPISELYLTILKTNSGNLFTNVSSGIETPVLSALTANTINHIKKIPAINRIHNGTTLPFITHVPLETSIDISRDRFYGDLVEYNRLEVMETILADVSHRFNTVNRETVSPIVGGYYKNTGTNASRIALNLGPRQEGYFYKAHWLIRIRDFSSYIEQGDINTEGMPSYVENLGDGRYLWRDMLDIGFNQTSEKTLDYPFLNGCHYMHQNVCFNVKRQDPFNIWGLFYSKFPSDSIGKEMTNKFTYNSEDYAC